MQNNFTDKYFTSHHSQKHQLHWAVGNTNQLVNGRPNSWCWASQNCSALSKEASRKRPKMKNKKIITFLWEDKTSFVKLFHFLNLPLILVQDINVYQCNFLKMGLNFCQSICALVNFIVCCGVFLFLLGCAGVNILLFEMTLENMFAMNTQSWINCSWMNCEFEANPSLNGKYERKSRLQPPS